MIHIGLLILRLSLGLTMLIAHGYGKLSGFSQMSESFPDPIGLGPLVSLSLTVFAEFFCALAVALGVLVRYASIPLFITMAVALFVVHGNDPFPNQEKALIYGLGFLSLIFTGGGKYTLDRMFKGNK